ncbi:hypothetical protein [Chryseobacterium sp. T20]|uniref:hypothetical protein n=1 Tax=Chryseobacterium sp. T20 TaxID=3395375 RepID=UPI0039BC7F4C
MAKIITASTTTNIGTWALTSTDDVSNFGVTKVLKNNRIIMLKDPLTDKIWNI